MTLKLSMGDVLYGEIDWEFKRRKFEKVILDDPVIDEKLKLIYLNTTSGLIRMKRGFDLNFTLNHLISGINFNLLNNKLDLGTGHPTLYSQGYRISDDKSAIVFPNYLIICDDWERFIRE